MLVRGFDLHAGSHDTSRVAPGDRLRSSKGQFSVAITGSQGRLPVEGEAGLSNVDLYGPGQQVLTKAEVSMDSLGEDVKEDAKVKDSKDRLNAKGRMPSVPDNPENAQPFEGREADQKILLVLGGAERDSNVDKDGFRVVTDHRFDSKFHSPMSQPNQAAEPGTELVSHGNEEKQEAQ